MQTGELPYLASWASHPAAIGLRLPEQQLEAVCGYVGRHMQELTPHDRERMLRAFKAWGHQPGVALLGP